MINFIKRIILEEKYLSFAKRHNKQITQNYEKWFFTTDKDFGDFVTIKPILPVTHSYIVIDNTKQYVTEWNDKRICVCPSAIQTLLALNHSEFRGKYNIYVTEKEEYAYKSFGNEDATEEHYLLRDTKFRRVKTIDIKGSLEIYTYRKKIYNEYVTKKLSERDSYKLQWEFIKRYWETCLL
ncbi:TPA: hypothetical protein QDB51_006096 [Burkholderia vietnamiensis]|nr:hypothetical protein [Burkholderia vietnamiensis]